MICLPVRLSAFPCWSISAVDCVYAPLGFPCFPVTTPHSCIPMPAMWAALIKCGCWNRKLQRFGVWCSRIPKLGIQPLFASLILERIWWKLRAFPQGKKKKSTRIRVIPYCIAVNTHTPAHTQMSASKTGEIWIRKVDYITINIPVLILCCSVARYYHWESDISLYYFLHCMWI